MSNPARKAQLLADGYTVVPQVLGAAAVARLRPVADRLLDAMPEDEQRARLSTGSLLSLWLDPAFAELIAWAPMWQAINELGYDAPRFSNGYVVSKPGLTPRTFWHHDWWGWDDARSYTPFIHQLGCIFYFDATDRENGCLRVIPGSHRRRHALHRPTSDERNRALRRYDDAAAPEFGDVQDEVDVPVSSGDMVLIDARLLHATHENKRPLRRTAALCWIIPDLEGWPGALRSRHPRHALPDSWPTAARVLVEGHLIHEGPLARLPAAYGLFPGEVMR